MFQPDETSRHSSSTTCLSSDDQDDSEPNDITYRTASTVSIGTEQAAVRGRRSAGSGGIRSPETEPKNEKGVRATEIIDLCESDDDLPRTVKHESLQLNNSHRSKEEDLKVRLRRIALEKREIALQREEIDVEVELKRLSSVRR